METGWDQEGHVTSCQSPQQPPWGKLILQSVS